MEKRTTTQQPEEIVKEQPKAGFLEKLRVHRCKILIGTLGILVFAGAVFGAYKFGQRQIHPSQPTPTPVVVATPTPDPTADWKTYTNTKYMYSIKYPEDWVLQPDKQVPDQIVGFRNMKELYRLSSHLSIYSGGAHTAVPPSAVLSETKSVIVAGQEATKEVYEKPYGEEGLLEWIKFSGEQKVGQIAIYKHGEGREHSDTLSLMLLTFRFLEEYIQSVNPKECTVDEDCRLERFRAGACCPLICDELWKGTVINKQEAEKREEWRKRNCQRAMCPLAECKPPDYTFEVKCDDKTCVAIKKVIKEFD